MTAKKIAQFLEVSLDELLSDDDMNLYVKNNAILDSSVSKRAQLVLLSLAFMCALIHTIIYFSNYLIEEPLEFISGGMIKSILLTIVLAYSVYVALYDKLNAKVASCIAALYFGCAIFSDLICLFEKNINIINMTLLCDLFYNLLLLMICIRFFQSKLTPSPVPLYIMTGVYALGELILLLICCRFVEGIPNEYYIGFSLRMLSLIESLFVIVLLSFMAYVLHKKRKLAARG